MRLPLPTQTVPHVREWLTSRCADAVACTTVLIDAQPRERAIDTCHDVWGNYEGTRLQCDEYPFSSTHEGANAGNDRYSARLIDGDDNEAGGRRLNSMYTANRILDGDPFYVKATS